MDVYTIVGILCILLLASLYGNYNIYRKYIIVETMLFNNDKNLENANEFILQLQDRVIRHNTTIRQIDDRGSFESDDEVGFFFEELKKMIEDISNYFASNTTIESDVFDDVD